MNNTRLIGILLIIGFLLAVILAIWFAAQAGTARRGSEEATAQRVQLEAQRAELEARIAELETQQVQQEARVAELEAQQSELEAQLERTRLVAVAPGQFEYTLDELPADIQTMVVTVTTMDGRTVSSAFETREAIDSIGLRFVGEDAPEELSEEGDSVAAEEEGEEAPEETPQETDSTP